MLASVPVEFHCGLLDFTDIQAEARSLFHLSSVFWIKRKDNRGDINEKFSIFWGNENLVNT